MISLLYTTWLMWSFYTSPTFIKKPSLIIDANTVNYINKQAIIDDAYRVILIGDTITVVDSVILNDVELVFVCNVFNGAKKISVIQSETKFKSGQRGINGFRVTIIARQVDSAIFYLPGVRGRDGIRGAPGKNGDSLRICRSNNNGNLIPILKGVEPGEPGKDGINGLRGGNGGLLTIFAVGLINSELDAPGADGGGGRRGGEGGITYITRPTEHTKNLDVDLQRLELKREKLPSGKPGKPGPRGAPGKQKIIPVSEIKFQSKVLEYSLHDLAHLSLTGWQIYFSKRI